MAVSIAAGEVLDHDTGSFVSRRGRRETLEFKGLWASDAAEIVLYRSPLSRVWLGILCVAAVAAAVIVSGVFPQTIAHVPFFVRGREFEIVLPLAGILPLGIMLILARSLLNHRYILTPNSLMEVRGLVGLRLVSSELAYRDIREVVVYQNPTQEFLDLGDIQVGSDVNEEEITLRGIHNPLRLKLIIRERMNAAKAEDRERKRRANDSW